MLSLTSANLSTDVFPAYHSAGFLVPSELYTIVVLFLSPPRYSGVSCECVGCQRFQVQLEESHLAKTPSHELEARVCPGLFKHRQGSIRSLGCDVCQCGPMHCLHPGTMCPLKTSHCIDQLDHYICSNLFIYDITKYVVLKTLYFVYILTQYLTTKRSKCCLTTHHASGSDPIQLTLPFSHSAFLILLFSFA